MFLANFSASFCGHSLRKVGLKGVPKVKGGKPPCNQAFLHCNKHQLTLQKDSFNFTTSGYMRNVSLIQSGPRAWYDN